MTTTAHRPDTLSRPRGRPREFDMEQALDGAIRVFSERGYQATAISDLSEAMGLSLGSIYKAFADKRAVFIAALDRYRQVSDAKFLRAIQQGSDGRARLHSAISYYAASAHGPAGRQGCLLIGCAVEFAIFDEDIARRVAASASNREALIAELIREGHADGSVPEQVDPDATARTILCVAHGMRVLGKTGRSDDEMAAVVETAMKILS